jgi:hypothetical protein
VCGGEGEREARRGEWVGDLSVVVIVAGTGGTASLLLRVFNAIVKGVSLSHNKRGAKLAVYTQ